MPICLLEVNTSTTRIDSSFQYEIYNNSVLKFAYGDEITLTCKRGYKALDPTVNMTCNPEHNGTWSRTLPSICRGTCIYWYSLHTLAKYDRKRSDFYSLSCLNFHCSQKLFVRILL